MYVPKDNDSLCSIQNHKEIKDVLSTMGFFKAYSLDGIPTFVFKGYREICGESLIDVVQKYFKTNYLNPVLNMVITFIKNVSNPP